MDGSEFIPEGAAAQRTPALPGEEEERGGWMGLSSSLWVNGDSVRVTVTVKWLPEWPSPLGGSPC